MSVDVPITLAAAERSRTADAPYREDRGRRLRHDRHTELGTPPTRLMTRLLDPIPTPVRTSCEHEGCSSRPRRRRVGASY